MLILFKDPPIKNGDDHRPRGTVQQTLLKPSAVIGFPRQSIGDRPAAARFYDRLLINAPADVFDFSKLCGYGWLQQDLLIAY